MFSELSNDSESFLSDAVSRGFYASRSVALEAAVELLRQRQQLVERLTEGRRQLDEGEYVEFDDYGLKEFFEQLVERAAERARAKP